jgi:hypothetical protein
MCMLCEMRRRAEAGDMEAEATLDAVTDPRMASGLALMVGQLMTQFGLTEFTMNPLTFDEAAVPGLAFEQDGPMLTARIVTRDQIEVELQSLSGNHTVN